TLSEALTTKKFYSGFEKSLQNYNPDTLLLLIQWAEKFQNYAEIESDNYFLYDAIYGFWLSKISNKIAFYSTQDNSIKYDFKYQFIVARCNEKHFSVAVSVTPVEKIIDNIVSKKW